jgi:hypothetical protein
MVCGDERWIDEFGSPAEERGSVRTRSGARDEGCSLEQLNCHYVYNLFYVQPVCSLSFVVVSKYSALI